MLCISGPFTAHQKDLPIITCAAPPAAPAVISLMVSSVEFEETLSLGSSSRSVGSDIAYGGLEIPLNMEYLDAELEYATLKDHVLRVR